MKHWAPSIGEPSGVSRR